ncbi:Chromosome partition protein Smc [Lactobacillus helveticus]|uniref:tape measure protein n=1 Tax=Lactobacillus helveticus TaxID=1587 RepID=UPI001563B117|nr:tape measure protein [Lactobacillus helveticus]NRO84168.1 Chromosome partition protein Smc [Lactobacillus helveticus]
MAGNIPMGSMSTEIKLNGSQSVKTLRELKQAVAQATSAWKAQRAELSTIGKSTEAAETKYKGLAETIKKQKDYISGLQEAQKHLKNAQQSVDRTTKKGRQEYGKYNEALQKNETRLHSAQQRLAGLADQQSKAKKSLDYYKSGLAEAQKQLQLNESVTKSYVARLSSEGKNYEAAKAKLNGYKDSIENLTKQQKIQEQELSKVASESGKSSEAYKRQQVRVNETAASLAKAKTQMTELGDSMKKANPSFLDKIKTKLSSVNSEADKTHHTFREVFMGSALGTALTNSLSNIGDQFKSIYKDGMEANSIAGKIDARFKNMGQSASGIKRLDAQIKELKYNTGMSADQIADLQSKMLNWSVIGQKGALQMTKAIAGIGDSSKMPADQIARMGASLMRVGSTGKVTYSALNRITKSAPAFYSQLAKGAGMSESKLKSLLQSGNVTQKQFQKWLAASSKYSDKAFKGYNATQAGAINRMQKAWTDLKKTMTAPLFKAKSTGLQALSQLLKSKELMSGAKAIGQGISQAIGVIYKHRKDIADVAKDFIQLGVSVGKAVWKDFSAIFVDIAKSFHLISGNSKSAGGPMHQLRLAMDKLAKNKTAIQIIAKAIELIAVAKLANAANGLFHISKIAGGSADALIGLAKGFKGVDDVSKLKGTQKTFYKLADFLKNSKLGSLATKAGKGIANGFHKGVKGISKATSWLGKKLLDAGKSLVSKATTLGQKIGNAITKAVKASTKFSMGKRLAVGALAGAAVATPEVMNAVKDRHSANKRSQDIGGAVGALAGGTLTSMIPVVGPMLAPVGAIIGKYAGRWGGQAVNKFTKGWQRKKPPKKFWSLENLGYSAHNMWKGFTKGVSNTIKWFKKNWKEVGLYFVSPLAGAINSLYKHNKGFHKWVNGLVKGFKNAWKGVTKWFSKLGKNIQKSWKGMTKWFAKLGSNMAKGLKSAWKSMTKWFSNIGNGIKKAWRSMTSWFTKLGKGMSKGLKATWHGVVQFFSNIGKNVKHAWNSMTSFFSKLGKNTANFFKRPWKAITGWFKSIISGIKSAWDGFWDHISGPIKTLQKLSAGKLKVGSLHLADGTDWRSRYGVPAVVNDASGENYREGLLVNGQVIPFPDKRNIPFWLLPGQDIVNGNDMAKMFGHAVHYADGTVHLSKDHEYSKKNYELAKKRAIEDKKELEKLGDKISNALKRKDGNEARRLTREFNKLTKKYSADKGASKKPNPHAGKVLVDQGLLIGAKSRIGHSVYISKSLFKKLIDNLKKKKTNKKRKASTHKHRRSASRGRSVRRVSRVSIPKVSSSRVSVKASVSGRAAVKGLASAIRSVKSRSVKLLVKASGSKPISSVAKAVKEIKGGTHKIKVKTSGVKSLKSLYKYTKKIKGKTHKVQVKTSGTKNLKSLQKNITSVHKQITSLTKAAKKNKFGKSISQQAKEAVKSLKGKGNFAKQFGKMTKKFDEDLKTMTKNSKKEFKSMWSQIEKTSTSSETNLTHQLNSFSSKYKHGWSSLESGVHKSFDHFWTSMENSAGKGVNKVIRILNSAIEKIDSVISEFGGSKSAVHKSGLVHYAGGTDANGRLMHDTLAIVNDAQSGPRQEAVITDQNDVILPHGKDVPVMLQKGWGVLNGTQTQQLGLSHFANGTGLKDLYELAKHNWGHPQKTGQALFSIVTGLTGAMKDLASGMRSKSEDSGVNWWSQLWKMVEDKVDDDLGPASGLLKAVEKLGRGKRYLWGGYGLDSKGLDCSGLISTALEHYYHSGWGHLDVGGLWHHAHKVSKSEAKPGDPVFWLPDEHIGVYAGHGMYYSAYGPNNGGPIGMQPVGSGATFGRFNGINTESNSKEPVKVKANNRLQKQIKNQVGQGFWKTIQKIADKYGEQFNGANSISGSMVEAAARKMHVNLPDGFVKDVLRVALSESGNRNIKQQIHDVNSGGNEAQGPLQFTPQTFKALAVAGHADIHNPYDELLAFFNNSDWKNSIGWTTIWGHRKFDWLHSGPQGHRRFANGGLATAPSVFGEAGPEMAIPLIPSKSTRAWELIGKAIAVLSGQSGLNQQQAQIDTKKEKEEHDFRQAMLLLLTQLVNKSNVADIKLKTPQGRTLWEVVEPFSKAESRAEMIKLRRGLSGR